MNILSIQSHVVYGHVGNSAAVFALQRLGCEVWPVHTVQFSNHPGHGAWRGQALDATLIRDVVAGIAERGVLATCDGVLSGYVGALGTGEAILDAVRAAKAANPGACYCCDPVIGDVGPGVYVSTGVPDFMRQRALPLADVATPNQFELEHLAGCPTPTRAAALAAIDVIRAIGPRVVLVTSLHSQETPADAIDLLACDQQASFQLRTPRLPLAINGAGDLVAALFFLHWLRTGSAGEALSRAVSSVFGILRRTAEAGGREMLLIGAQDELVTPSRIFSAQPIER
jgi:pyridoxine kinase